MLLDPPISLFHSKLDNEVERRAPMFGGNGALRPDTRHEQFAEKWAGIQVSVRAYLLSFLGHSAVLDDCLQEVALVVWKKAPFEEGMQSFLAYALGCAKRIALAARRRQADGRLEWLSPQAASALADMVAQQEANASQETPQRIHHLQLCLAQLPPPQRELVEARYAIGHETLAAYSGRTGSSMDCLYKKLERLREILRLCVTRRQPNKA